MRAVGSMVAGSCKNFRAPPSEQSSYCMTFTMARCVPLKEQKKKDNSLVRVVSTPTFEEKFWHFISPPSPIPIRNLVDNADGEDELHATLKRKLRKLK